MAAPPPARAAGAAATRQSARREAVAAPRRHRPVPLVEVTPLDLCLLLLRPSPTAPRARTELLLLVPATLRPRTAAATTSRFNPPVPASHDPPRAVAAAATAAAGEPGPRVQEAQP